MRVGQATQKTGRKKIRSIKSENEETQAIQFEFNGRMNRKQIKVIVTSDDTNKNLNRLGVPIRTSRFKVQEALTALKLSVKNLPKKTEKILEQKRESIKNKI